MIRRDDLYAIAKMKGLSPKLAEADYLQDVALLGISREFGNRLIFKGGTCLYKLYRLNRFSEDLDFTAAKGFKQKDFFQRLPFFFNLLDIKSTVRVERFGSGINVYLEISGPLYAGTKETRVALILNISLRERILLPAQRFPYTPLYHEIRPFDLFAMDEREILAEKIRAIYRRNKARDVYDLWYLFERRGLRFDPAFANKKLLHDNLKFDKDAFIAKLGEKRSSWERDLGGLVAGELPSFAQAKKKIGQSL